MLVKYRCLSLAIITHVRQIKTNPFFFFFAIRDAIVITRHFRNINKTITTFRLKWTCRTQLNMYFKTIIQRTNLLTLQNTNMKTVYDLLVFKVYKLKQRDTKTFITGCYDFPNNTRMGPAKHPDMMVDLG